MSIRQLDRIFAPRNVAVIGASAQPRKVGHAVLRNLIAARFEGPVYPVNPRTESILGLRSYARVSELPEPPDLAVICTPAATVPDLVRECGEAGVGGLVIISAGFRESGAKGQELEERVRAAAAAFPQMRIVGPNCVGLMSPASRLNASFGKGFPQPGSVAFVSQSGAVCTSVLDWALEEEVGFSHFVSIGNMLDVDFADLIDFFNEDPATRAVILYVESIGDARRFMSAARAFARSKPIVAYKAGRFPASAAAAASHTGAMAGEDAVYDAAFARAGIVRAAEFGDLFDCAELLARGRIPRGSRLGIVTNAGGPGIMAVDALLAGGGALAPLSPETIESLDRELPPFWSRANPVDILGDAAPDRFRSAVAALLDDPACDAALVILAPQMMTDPAETADVVAATAANSHKPVLAAWLGGASIREGMRRLNASGIPTYSSPERAIRAFQMLVSFARRREALYETPQDVPVEFSLAGRVAPILTSEEEGSLLTESRGKELLATYGIPVAQTLSAATADEAVAAAGKIGYPVVLKLSSPDITHKTEVGGVELNLTSDDEVRNAFERIVQRARAEYPQARIDGVTVQPMIASVNALEVIVGMKRDATFGAVLLVGTGGVAAEVFQDRILELPPLNERLARRMLESLRSWPLLRGFRGRPPLAVDKLIETLIRFSYLVTDVPHLAEFEINPLLVTTAGTIALDARGVVAVPPDGGNARPFAHLAIRPYPVEFIREVTLRDGTPVTFRPIRPEDEHAWRALLADCSPDSLHARFRYMFRGTTHEMATRFCFTDYDREMAIVAELEDEGATRIAAVGRLVADPDRGTAEFAILVGDRWQGRGLGGMLMSYCLEVARVWGVSELTAETDWNNHRMLALFRREGFAIEDSPDGAVRARLVL